MPRGFKRLLQYEALENRRVMATLVNSTTVTYQDIDGDDVTVKFSRPVLTSQAVANNVFGFSVGSVNNSNALKQQLNEIDLASIAAAAGTTISLNAVRNNTNGGDGFAALGQILANLDLGNVTIDGDLGRIDAGDANVSTTGVAGLTVKSLGRFGLTTGATSLSSLIDGRLGQFTVKGDMHKSALFVQGGVNGTIGSITISGSIIGDTLETGRIMAAGNVGAVQIDGDLRGGSGGNSGFLEVFGKIASLKVGGSIRGDVGSRSGSVRSIGIGAITIQGSLIGGDGNESGFLYSDGDVASLKLGGSVIGSNGADSGAMEFRSSVGPVTIAGNIQGGVGTESGRVEIDGTVARWTMDGSLLGGSGGASGQIIVKDGLVNNSRISCDVIGGSGNGSGQIGLGAVGANNLTIGGAVRGGTANGSGGVSAAFFGTLTIGGDLVGGSASGIVELKRSGLVSANRISKLTIGGSIVAGVDATSGEFEDNGAVRVAQELSSLTVNGSLIGNSTNRVLITANRQVATSTTVDLAIGSVKIGGRVEYARIRAGISYNIGAENADAQIGSVTVGGDWIASSITAGTSVGPDGLVGTADDLKLDGIGVKDSAGIVSKINSITIGGQLIGTPGGGDHFGFVAEQLGTIRIGGTTIPLVSGKSNDNKLLGVFGDFRAREI